MNSRLRNFNSDTTLLVKLVSKSKKSLLAAVVCIDIVSALLKILSILVIAFAIQVLRNEKTVELFNAQLTIEASISSLVVLGILVGISALLSALGSYWSFLLSRKLGRWGSEYAHSAVAAKLSEPVSASISIDERAIPKNSISLLTQIPLHVGLSIQTLSRLINPLLLFCFSFSFLIFLNWHFAAFLAVFGLLALPVAFKIGVSTQSNARQLYTHSSNLFGSRMNERLTQLTYQHGVTDKTSLFSKWSPEETSAQKDFLDALDTNLMANQKMTLLVGTLDALLRPILFVVLCAMIFFGQLSIEAAIAFLGCIGYIFSSATKSISLTTNLIKYQPQVKRFLILTSEKTSFESTTSPSSTPKKIRFRGNLESGSARNEHTLMRGEALYFLSSASINSLNLNKVLNPIFEGCTDKNTIFVNTSFVSARYRFSPTTIISQLCGGVYNQQLSEQVQRRISSLDSSKTLFSELPKRLESELSESTWKLLSALERFCLRIVPLTLKKEGELVIIDAKILKSGGPTALETLDKWFSDKFLIIVTSDNQIPFVANSKFAASDESNRVKFGDQHWFVKQALRNTEPGKDSDDSSSLDLIF